MAASMAYRLFNIQLSEEAFRKEKNYILEMGRVNGYEKYKIENILRKHDRKKRLQWETTLTIDKDLDSRGEGLMELNFCPPLSDKIKKIAKKNDVKCYHNGKGTLGDMLINLKDKKKAESKSGIYEISCASCDSYYIGQTRRRTKIRWNEHEAALRNKKPTKSAIADHCLENGHTIGSKRLIKEVLNPFHFNAWESYFICNGENLVNEYDDTLIKSKLFEISKRS